jgi:hypothetical protein
MSESKLSSQETFGDRREVQYLRKLDVNQSYGLLKIEL